MCTKLLLFLKRLAIQLNKLTTKNQLLTYWVVILCLTHYSYQTLAKAPDCDSTACLWGDDLKVDPMKQLRAKQSSSMLLIDDIIPDTESLALLEETTNSFINKENLNDNLNNQLTVLQKTQNIMDYLYIIGMIENTSPDLKRSLFISSKPKK